MNAIKVNAKTVVLVPAKTAAITELTWRTSDDPFARRLHIVVNNAAAMALEGADYDALGDWNDATIKKLVMDWLGVQEA